MFVFGPVGDGVDAVDVQHVDRDTGPTGEQTVRAPVYTAGGPPGGLYVAVVPVSWCWVQITAADGTADPALGPTGPLPMDPAFASCTG